MSESEKDILFINQFGTNLRRIRKQKHLSIEALAGMSGIDYTTLSRIELGNINTRISTVNSIAKALEVSPMALFDFEREE